MCVKWKISLTYVGGTGDAPSVHRDIHYGRRVEVVSLPELGSTNSIRSLQTRLIFPCPMHR